MESTNSGGRRQGPPDRRDSARHRPAASRSDRPAIPGRRTPSTKYEGGEGAPLTECPWPIGNLTDKTTGETFGKPCGRRRCPYCGERLRRCHVAHYTEAFRDRPALYAATLTIDPKVLPDDLRRDADAQVSALIDQVWKSFRDRLTKACKKHEGEFAYVGAHERHGGGLPHIHALLSFPHPEAEEAMAAQWFKSGGGAVLAIQPIEGGEGGVARWLGYCLKQSFGKTAPGGRRLLASKGIGYYTEAAKARRKMFVDDLGRYAYTPPEEVFRPDNAARARGAFPVGAIDLHLGQRSTRYLRHLAGTPYGVRVELDEDGRRTHTLVETGPEYARIIGTYPVLGTFTTMSEAEAETARLASSKEGAA